MTPQDAPVRLYDAPGTHRFVPVAEAACILGLSPTTIRRRIEAGELEAERVVRPQGTAFLVKVPNDAPPHAAEAPTTPPDAPGTHQDEPPSAAALAAVVLALVAQVDALRQTVVAQAETIRDQAETIGRQGAELEAERSARQRLLTERDVWNSRRRRLLLAHAVLAVVATLALATAAAPAWVR